MCGCGFGVEVSALEPWGAAVVRSRHAVAIHKTRSVDN
jgi:hypothetical protein